MKNTIKHIAVFTSGGDSPGMNACLFAIAKSAELHDVKLSGIRRGYEGMIDGEFVDLKANDLKKIVYRGGTILKTARSQRFLSLSERRKALKQLQKKEIDALIAIGGDGTFKGLLVFSEICELPCIGIPGTIDNDLAGTDYTLGFDTAINSAIENIDKIRDTAESHNRIFLIEVMGKDAGYIAIHSGLASAVDSILIPESKGDFFDLLEKVKHYNSEEAFIVVIAEGDEFTADYVASKIKEINSKVDLRISRLGHIQRGGNPSAFDRMLGIRLGAFAVTKILSNKTDVMAGIVNNQLCLTPFEHVVKQHELNKELQSLVKIFSK